MCSLILKTVSFSAASCIRGFELNNEYLQNWSSKYFYNLACVVVWSPHNSGSNFTVSNVRGSYGTEWGVMWREDEE